MLILQKLNDVNQIKTIASKLLHSLTQAIEIMGHKIVLKTSIGISLYPNTGTNIEELLRQADSALYQVKAKGKGDYQIYISD